MFYLFCVSPSLFGSVSACLVCVCAYCVRTSMCLRVHAHGSLCVILVVVISGFELYMLFQ